MSVDTVSLRQKSSPCSEEEPTLELAKRVVSELRASGLLSVHSRRGRKIKNSFTGADAAAWMRRTGIALSDAEVETTADYLIRTHIFVPVVATNRSLDPNGLYLLGSVDEAAHSPRARVSSFAVQRGSPRFGSAYGREFDHVASRVYEALPSSPLMAQADPVSGFSGADFLWWLVNQGLCTSLKQAESTRDGLVAAKILNRGKGDNLLLATSKTGRIGNGCGPASSGDSKAAIFQRYQDKITSPRNGKLRSLEVMSGRLGGWQNTRDFISTSSAVNKSSNLTRSAKFFDEAKSPKGRERMSGLDDFLSRGSSTNSHRGLKPSREAKNLKVSGRMRTSGVITSPRGGLMSPGWSLKSSRISDHVALDSSETGGSYETPECSESLNTSFDSAGDRRGQRHSSDSRIAKRPVPLSLEGDDGPSSLPTIQSPRIGTPRTPRSLAKMAESLVEWSQTNAIAGKWHVIENTKKNRSAYSVSDHLEAMRTVGPPPREMASESEPTVKFNSVLEIWKEHVDSANPDSVRMSREFVTLTISSTNSGGQYRRSDCRISPSVLSIEPDEPYKGLV